MKKKKMIIKKAFWIIRILNWKMHTKCDIIDRECMIQMIHECHTNDRIVSYFMENFKRGDEK